MKKNDFIQFQFSLNLNMDIDNSLRCISEKIKLLSQLRASDTLKSVADVLTNANSDIDKLIENICNDESEN